MRSFIQKPYFLSLSDFNILLYPSRFYWSQILLPLQPDN